jgi:cystathionine beta-lyase/cystathionine gamma-synthase
VSVLGEWDMLRGRLYISMTFLNQRFPYTDTLKVLQKWGPGAHFFGNGLDADIDTLETLLESESKSDSSKPPILSLFTEFPSNPLLRSANLPRLRALADKYEFLLVVDETIGNFINVEVLPYADIVVSSLTKVFSGASNVMGGRYVILHLFSMYPMSHPPIKSCTQSSRPPLFFPEVPAF